MELIERTHCPGCCNNSFQQIFSCLFSAQPIKEYLIKSYPSECVVAVSKGNYILCECSNCGLIFQKEILNPDGMRKLYEQWTGQSSYSMPKHIELFQEISSLIDYLERPPFEIACLDFGMGDGQWPAMAGALGCRSFGYDLSEARIHEAKDKGFQILLNEELEKTGFDFINTEQVLEHVAEPLSVLQRLKKCLNKNGLIKISVPNGRKIKQKLEIGNWLAKKGSKQDLNPVAPLEHINCFNATAILKMAEAANLKRVTIPLSIQYRYSLRWNSFKWFRKNLIKPLKRNFTLRSTYLFFTPQ